VPSWFFAGRNFYEVLRFVDALQLAFFHQVRSIIPRQWPGNGRAVDTEHMDSTQGVMSNPHVDTYLAQCLPSQPGLHLGLCLPT
jgi:hypothetical protein